MQFNSPFNFAFFALFNIIGLSLIDVVECTRSSPPMHSRGHDNYTRPLTRPPLTRPLIPHFMDPYLGAASPPRILRPHYFLHSPAVQAAQQSPNRPGDSTPRLVTPIWHGSFPSLHSVAVSTGSDRLDRRSVASVSSSWDAIKERYHSVTKLCESGYGDLFQAFRNSDEEHVVFKHQKHRLQAALYEAEIQKAAYSVDPEHTTQLLEFYEDSEKDTAIIESEFGGAPIKRGEGEFMKPSLEAETNASTTQLACELMLQIGRVLQGLNERRILVQDAKLENILYTLDERGTGTGVTFKLIDFGNALDFNKEMPPADYVFAATQLIMTNAQIYLEGKHASAEGKIALADLESDPVFRFIAEKPSRVDMQALVVNVLDFILRVEDFRHELYNAFYPILHDTYPVQEISSETVREKIMENLAQKLGDEGRGLVELLNRYYPEPVPTGLKSENLISIEHAFKNTMQKFDDWNQFLSDVEFVCST